MGKSIKGAGKETDWKREREQEVGEEKKGGVLCLVFIHVCMIRPSRAISPDGE